MNGFETCYVTALEYLNSLIAITKAVSAKNWLEFGMDYSLDRKSIDWLLNVCNRLTTITPEHDRFLVFGVYKKLLERFAHSTSIDSYLNYDGRALIIWIL